MITVRHCSIADRDHEKRLRQYAHTYHYKNNVICVASAFKYLPFDHQMGLLAHELGHLLMGYSEHKESEADKMGNLFFDVTIKYKDSRYGENLQYLTTREGNRVWGWFLDNAVFNPYMFRR